MTILRNRAARVAVVGLVAVGTAVAACTDSTRPKGPRISIVRGADIRDTVAGFPGPLLEITVFDSTGRPAPSQPVRFFVPLPEGKHQPASVIDESGSRSSVSLIDTTDSRGRIVVRFFLAQPGVAIVRITALSLGTEIEVPLTVLPGSPVAVVASPGDTGLYVGRSAILRGSPVDQFRNPIDLPVTLRSLDEAIVSASGKSVSGRTLGTGRIVMTYERWADTVNVSVVPIGVVAIRRGTSIAQVNLDGSGYRALASAGYPNLPGNERAMMPRWDPPGNAVVYYDATSPLGAGLGFIFVGDGNGPPRRLFPNSRFDIELHPDWSPAGDWIYFGARLRGSAAFSLWRAHPDGSGVERLPDAPDRTTAEVYETHPAISPDGQWVAYESREVYGRTPRLRVRHIATGARTAIDVRAASARWSPDGSTLAYIDNDEVGGALILSNPDGSNRRRLSTRSFAGELDWSPDGRYIVAFGGFPTSLALVDTATGNLTMLPYLSGDFPAWRRQ
jgi:hypothetical protein